MIDSKTAKKVLVFIIVVIVYFAFRLPLYDHRIIGEEGIFANVFYSQTKAPDYALIAKINGQKVLVPDNHPAPIFEMINFAGLPFKGSVVDLSKKTQVARFIFSLFLFVPFALTVGIFLFRFTLKQALFPVLLLTATAISPAALSNSIHLRLDTSSGVLLCGAAAVAIYFATQQKSLARQIIIAFAGSLLIGLGKPEWSLAFFFAFAFALIIHRPFGKNQRQVLGIGAACVTGALAGNLISLGIDPANYLGNIDLLMLRVRQMLKPDNTPFATGFVIADRLFFLSGLISVFAFSTFSVLKKREFITTGVYLFAVGLFLAYLPVLFNLPFHQRYFAPALVLFITGLLFCWPEKPGRATKAFSTVLAVFILATYLYFSSTCIDKGLSITDGFGNRVTWYFSNKEEIIFQSKRYGCVPILPNWTNYTHPSADFVIPSLGVVQAEKVVEKAGGRLCK